MTLLGDMDAAGPIKILVELGYRAVRQTDSRILGCTEPTNATTILKHRYVRVLSSKFSLSQRAIPPFGLIGIK